MFHYVKNSALLLISLFFLLFGVHVLLSAYHLSDPFAFIMTFFASNLIILISAALAVGFAIRLWRRRHEKTECCRPPEEET
ncbi:MAG: hypothetical protein C4519_26530 [Desulfobacteraceae bacterium]|nr:MAG: hypothetical protein C4519_26530 [Desulfobacteraceae bacterium]